MNLKNIIEKKYSAFDILPGSGLAEKAAALMLERSHFQESKFTAVFDSFRQKVNSYDTTGAKVVVFGGGTGLSTIIGGDSKQASWKENPFTGLKQVFSQLHSIVCITDDGGSTGELLKELPLIALGDLRHVLLSAIHKNILIKRYQVDVESVQAIAVNLHQLFNYRFITHPQSATQLRSDTDVDFTSFPEELSIYISDLIERLFADKRLASTLLKPQCLGNLLLASAIYGQIDQSLDKTHLIASYQVVRTATIKGLKEIGYYIGVQNDSLWPCTTTPSQLQILYNNGVLVTSECKSYHARRGYPVDRVFTEFSRKPFLPSEIVGLVSEADIIIFAPGSLYTSIIPIMQVPGIVEAIRSNKKAIKLLVSNIWVQKGETDTSRNSPERKFYVSDLIQAYHRNIPGGIEKLFSHVLSLDMRNVPGSILQRYALEDKEPIYLDRTEVEKMGLRSISAKIFSEELLYKRGVIQHDPDALSIAVKTIWFLKETKLLKEGCTIKLGTAPAIVSQHTFKDKIIPCLRYEKICSLFNYISTEIISEESSLPLKMEESQRRWLIDRLVELVWLHPDILFDHLKYFRGITLVTPKCWNRSQQWDNVFSFYDPIDRKIKIRQDQAVNINRFEVVFLIALGQSLLGDYAFNKEVVDITSSDEVVGKMYRLTLRESQQIDSFLNVEELGQYLGLCKMQPFQAIRNSYSRVVNFHEGFTPPGLFFGLFYAWYLDNRFAPNIDYKMSIIRHDISDLIPEQIRIRSIREKTIDFFREKVFRQIT